MVRNSKNIWSLNTRPLHVDTDSRTRLANNNVSHYSSLLCSLLSAQATFQAIGLGFSRAN